MLYYLELGSVVVVVEVAGLEPSGLSCHIDIYSHGFSVLLSIIILVPNE